ncbi:hypothetical protein ABG768_018013 [Culter alburnus]|uniref:Chemokine interleukin-8-like domain-containing protein n=1 Tax=Culter alburnus TaxID=194366 RepID=A0AAW1YTD9_CULAL
MRASSLCLVFGVVLLMAWTSEAQQAAAVPLACCFSFIDFPIPDSKVVKAVRTPSSCPATGIVVTTPKTQFCVNPDEAWIKKHL